MAIHGNYLEKREEFSQLANSFRISSVILTANELGIFQALSSSAKTADALAEELSLSYKGMKYLLDALAALDLLAKNNDLYSLHGFSLEFLTEGSEGYLGNIFRHNFRLMKRWVNLDEAVRTGKPLVEHKQRAARSEEDLRAFILGMEDIARYSAQELVDVIDLKGVKDIFDLGGGPGSYLIAFLNRLPQARGTLLDFPEVLKIADEQIKKAEMQNRINFIAGDMLSEEYGGAYDLVILSNIIHSHSAEDIRSIFAKCHQCLRPSGRILVKDFFLHESRIKPLHGALFTLNMFLATEEGRSYTWNEVEGWLIEANFNIAQKCGLARHSGLIVGRKNG